MSLLTERIRELEADLLADPPRISAYHDLPFAILHYDPAEEFEARRQIELLTTRVANAGKRVRVISLARILWRAIESTEGIRRIAEAERKFGYRKVEETVSVILSERNFYPLADALEREMREMDPQGSVAFLVRLSALAPGIYRAARLLNEMHGRTLVPMILFYPGGLEGDSTLKFMNLPGRDQTGAYNYRVKIY